MQIEPFGVHIWNDTTVSERSAALFLETELKNYGAKPMQGVVTQQLLDAKGAVVATIRKTPKSSTPMRRRYGKPAVYRHRANPAESLEHEKALSL